MACFIKREAWGMSGLKNIFWSGYLRLAAGHVGVQAAGGSETNLMQIYLLQANTYILDLFACQRKNDSF